MSTEKKTNNPFKDKTELENEIKSFLNKHRAFLSNQADRISDYFEMCCYNYIVRFYQAVGYTVSVENLKGKGFKYKLSPAGYPENFSFFKIFKDVEIDSRKLRCEFEIHHNLTIQSSHQEDIYITPDIAVININSVEVENDHYLVKNSSKKFCYVQNKNLQTFCEVKQFNPFPELIFSFMGLFSEIINTVEDRDIRFEHIAPSLMISGKGKLHTNKIKESVEGRHPLNMIFDLFQTGPVTFSKKYASALVTVGSKNISLTNTPEEKEEAENHIDVFSEDDLPF